MSPSQSLPAPAATVTPSYRIFMHAGLLSPFNLKRAAFVLLVPLPIMALCDHFGQGVLGVVLMTLAFWPFPHRCRVEQDGLRVSWLFIREVTLWNNIERLELAEDGRRGVIGKRPLELLIERRNKPPIILRGRPAVLSQLATAITSRAS